MDLYPTKTRLQLLDDVDAGRVFRDALGIDYISGGRKVAASLHELEAVGWVELLDGSTYWRLTDAGLAIRAGVR